MAEITASMVKELREKTDAPMMECKKALTEAAGDMAKAEEILRVKLGNKASKAATRVAAEGVVAIHIAADGKLGSIFEINSETDFVAKNDEFLKLAADCARWWPKRTRPTSPPVGPADGRGHGRIDPHRAGRQDRREHEHPPLRAHRGQGQAGVLHPRRFEDRRAGRPGRRRRATGQGPGDAHRRLEAEVAGRRAFPPNCWTPSAASRSKRRAKPASRKRCWKRSPKARCRST
jgi:hypothetical protein